MNESTTRAKGFFTYAAFSASHGQAAGWRVGQCEGLSPETAEQLSNQVPSYLANEAPVPRYAGEKELKELIHRSVWRSNPLNSNENLFIHSTPAGTDASGRPSNVFTTVYVFDADTDLGIHPAQMLGSSALLVPFNKEVNNRRVESLEIIANPTVTPRAAFDHLMAATRKSFSHIRDIVATVLDSLAGDGRVIIGDDTANAWAWIALLNFAVDRVSATRYGFSTYEREHTIGTKAAPGTGVYVMPREDLPKVTATTSMFDAIDVARGAVRGQLGGDTQVGDDAGTAIPVTPLSVLFKHVVSSPRAAEELLQEPRSAVAPADKLVALAQRHADKADEQVRQALAMLSDRSAAEPAYPATGESAPDNPFSAPARDAKAYERASASTALRQVRQGRAAAEVREVPAEAIARINQQLDTRQTGLVWTGQDYRGWPDFSELLLAVSAPGDELWNVQARLFATAAASLLQRPEAALEVDWLPWWKLEDDAELQATVRRKLLAYTPTFTEEAAAQVGQLAEHVRSAELRGLLESFRHTVQEQLRTARNPYVGLRGDTRQGPSFPPNPLPPRSTGRYADRNTLDKE